MSKARNVAILIYNDVEVLDFCGPYEVFSITGRRNGSNPFNVYTVAEYEKVSARNSLQVLPAYTLDTCPTPDILVVPGGGGFFEDGTPFGSRLEMQNETLLAWLRYIAPKCEHVLSVCTGALILAKAGLCDGLKLTTHHMAFESLRNLKLNIDIIEDQRVVDNGRYIFSGGISAGIDASFHVVNKLLGASVAEETANYMEYDWSREKT